MNKKNLLTGLILFLLLTNIATILTVLIHINRHGRDIPSVRREVAVIDSTEIPGSQRFRFLSEKLGLSPEQQGVFRALSREYGWQSRQISMEMNRLRDDLLEEMDRPEPDAAILDSLAGQIGIQHVALKKLTVKHYLGLKELCKDQQKKELYLLFRKILNPEGDVVAPRGMGRPAGAGPPANRGPWWKDRKDSISNK